MFDIVILNGRVLDGSGAAAQRLDENSLYTHYKKLIMIRKANPEIAHGDYRALSFTGTKVGGFAATAESGTVYVLHNTSISSATVTLPELEGTSIRAVVGAGEASIDGDTVTLAGQTSVVLR